MIDWSTIDTVLLDMDGTLLDLHFDNHFWLEHVPKRYAEVKGLDPAAAADEMMGRYQAVLGTLDWYCVDYWSRELGMDIAMLKQEVSHLIAVHPHVLEFLDALAAAGKRRVLVTNAHQKSLALKLDKTALGGHLDRLLCAHEFGMPKEQAGFWDKLRAVEPFDPARTLFVDDSLSVLHAAADYGIRWLLAISHPDSRQSRREVTEFPAVADFSTLIPDLVAGQ
jgi:HAD superfamily hydrolase (TIGR01509 family)